jgi:hypothetical protein
VLVTVESTWGAGVGLPGIAASTNYKALLVNVPITFLATTTTFKFLPVRDEARVVV